MVVGHPPFRHKEGENDEETVRERILDCDFDQNDTWKQLSFSLQNLILKTFEMDYEIRISASEILLHDWLDPPIRNDLMKVDDIENGCDIESSITPGDLDSIFSSMDDDEVEVVENLVVPVENHDEELIVMIEPELIPVDAQSAEENNNMRNGEQKEDETEETASTFGDEEDLYYFEAVEVEKIKELKESLSFELPKNLVYKTKIPIKKTSAKSVSATATHKSVPIKKRPNYFKSPDEFLVPIPICTNNANIEVLDLLGFRNNSYHLNLKKTELLREYENGLSQRRKGRATILDSDFQSSSIVELRKLKKIIVKTTNLVSKPLRKRRCEIDLSAVTMSPRKTRSSLCKQKEGTKPKRMKFSDQNTTTDFDFSTKSKVNPLASTSRRKPLALVRPLRKRKTEEDGRSKRKSNQDKKQGQILKSDDDLSTYSPLNKIRILVKESY